MKKRNAGKKAEFSFDWSMLPFLLFWIAALIGLIFVFVIAGFPIPVEDLPATWSDDIKNMVSSIITIAVYLFVGALYFCFFFLSLCLEVLGKALKLKHYKGDNDQ